MLMALLPLVTQTAMFSEADAYERFMGRWSQKVAPLMVAFARVRDGDAVLDVGSGTGALTDAVAAAAPTSGITGIDPAMPYVAFAQARHQGERVRFEVGDAQQMRFADATFDQTLSLLVVNFIPDPAKALGEMIRVTRPGGTVAAAVWDYGEGMEMLRVFWDEAIALKPRDEKRDERHMPLCRKGELSALWRKHGLQDVTEEGLTIDLAFASFDDYWLPFLDKQGPAGAYVATLTVGEREELRLRLRQRLLDFGKDRPIKMKARVWAVRGTVAPRLQALAVIAQIEDRDEEAELSLRRALALVAPESAQHAECLNGLAAVLLRRREPDEAQRLASRALRIWERLFGRDSVQSINGLNSLADAHLLRGEVAEAERLLRRADRVAALENASATVRAAVAVRRGVLWLSQGRYAEAESVLERSLELAEEGAGADHPVLVHIARVLSQCYRLRNRPLETRPTGVTGSAASAGR